MRPNVSVAIAWLLERGRLALAVLALSCASPVAHAPPAAAPSNEAAAPPVDSIELALATLRRDVLLADVAWLTSDEYAGRGTFTDDAKRVARRLVHAFELAGLVVYTQSIPDSKGQVNVMGVLPGADDVVVVCAHYDHLGVVGGSTLRGADDNASGVAVLLSMARAVGKTHRGKTVVFLATGAEESGLHGSQAYVAKPLFPLTRTLALINFDMVGRNFFEVLGGFDNTMAVVGAESAPYLRTAVDAAAKAEEVRLVSAPAGIVRFLGFDRRTDDYWFRQAGVPAIHFSTGLHRDYHKSTDTIDRIKPEQIERVARVATRVLIEIAELQPTSRRSYTLGRDVVAWQVEGDGR